ncbi:MAG TPA: LLM class F420-dependent oxidoreductase [Candidatus Binataceae bacterium]|nr:LLM class F420-dependent oxidoreductase [Candidatus Binataceae bacterium]
MDIGFLAAPTAQSGNLAELARTVEELGYESLWIPEHPVIPTAMKTEFPFTPDRKLPEHYGRWADPFIALTVAACATRKIKLGTGICLLPEREVLITAKVTATLDLFSGGRLILGIGAGWLREETEVMGANFGLRWKRTREMVEALRLLWTQREAAYQGEIVRFPAVRCEPKPAQKGGPAVLLGAHGPKSLERVARSYDGWMPLVQSPDELHQSVAQLRALTKSHGRDPDALHISPLLDPMENGPSADDLKRYRDAGAQRLILLSQKTVAETADGRALDLIRRFSPVVERASKIK